MYNVAFPFPLSHFVSLFHRDVSPDSPPTLPDSRGLLQLPFPCVPRHQFPRYDFL